MSFFTWVTTKEFELVLSVEFEGFGLGGIWVTDTNSLSDE